MTLVAGRWSRSRDAARADRAGASLPSAGVFFGLSRRLPFEAYWRGRVSVVSPLVATESLWGVGLSVLLIRQTEGVGRKLAFGALLVVLGSAVLGVYR